MEPGETVATRLGGDVATSCDALWVVAAQPEFTVILPQRGPEPHVLREKRRQFGKSVDVARCHNGGNLFVPQEVVPGLQHGLGPPNGAHDLSPAVDGREGLVRLEQPGLPALRNSNAQQGAASAVDTPIATTGRGAVGTPWWQGAGSSRHPFATMMGRGAAAGADWEGAGGLG